MTTTDPSVTVLPPAPLPPEPGHRRGPRRPATVILSSVVALLCLALVVAGVLGVRQHSHITDVSAHNKTLTGQLHTTRGHLSDTQDELDSTKSQLSDANTRLTSCSAVTRIGRLQYHQVLNALGATTALANFQVGVATDKINQVSDSTDQVTRILRDSGYAKDITGLWNACTLAERRGLTHPHESPVDREVYGALRVP